MIQIRLSEDRGKANLSWLNSKHTFSFSNYYDPQYMGFSVLRVINEDQINPSQGFHTHSHRDMEIITYIIEGELKHQDSLGHGSIIQHGEIQRMSAGTGISHSEFNASDTDRVHLLQIWILPNQQGLTPSYEQKYFSPHDAQGKLKLVGSPDQKDESITIHQDVNLYVSYLNQGEKVKYPLSITRKAWLQVVKGKINLNNHILSEGDGAGILEEQDIEINSLIDQTEFLLFDLPDHT
jgi:quercetin 2,3-dioxygenase